jgi:predicted kinase
MTGPKAVIATRGIPASGKSTWVQQQINNATPGTAARINNDDLSAMFYGHPFSVRSDHNAAMLESLRKQMLTALLRNPDIEVIFLDNTNLSVSALRKLEAIAHQHGAHFAVNDEFLKVPLETALHRNSLREIPVPDHVIREAHKRALKLRPWNFPRTPDIQPYHNDPSLRNTVIVDIDGTLAIKHPDRDIHDYAKVHMDSPNTSVVALVKMLIDRGHHVTIMSGRSEDCRDVTEQWLSEHLEPGLPLYMRPSKDHRPDWIIKHELFQQHIADQFHVRFVLDDRDQVVTLWRDRLQLPTYQVAHGDF